MTTSKRTQRQAQVSTVRIPSSTWALAEELRARLGLRSVAKLVEKLVLDTHNTNKGN